MLEGPHSEKPPYWPLWIIVCIKPCDSRPSIITCQGLALLQSKWFPQCCWILCSWHQLAESNSGTNHHFQFLSFCLSLVNSACYRLMMLTLRLIGGWWSASWLRSLEDTFVVFLMSIGWPDLGPRIRSLRKPQTWLPTSLDQLAISKDNHGAPPLLFIGMSAPLSHRWMVVVIPSSPLRIDDSSGWGWLLTPE